MGLIYDLTQAESIIDTDSIYCTVGRAKARTASGLGEVGRLGALALAPVMTRQAILGRWRRESSGLLPPGNASPGSLRRLRFLEVADCAFELVAATGIAEADDMAVIFGG